MACSHVLGCSHRRAPQRSLFDDFFGFQEFDAAIAMTTKVFLRVVDLLESELLMVRTVTPPAEKHRSQASHSKAAQWEMPSKEPSQSSLSRHSKERHVRELTLEPLSLPLAPVPTEPSLAMLLNGDLLDDVGRRDEAERIFATLDPNCVASVNRVVTYLSGESFRWGQHHRYEDIRRLKSAIRLTVDQTKRNKYSLDSYEKAIKEGQEPDDKLLRDVYLMNDILDITSRAQNTLTPTLKNEINKKFEQVSNAFEIDKYIFDQLKDRVEGPDWRIDNRCRNLSVLQQAVSVHIEKSHTLINEYWQKEDERDC